MSKYNFDAEFTELLPFFPTVSDFSSAEKIQAIRLARNEQAPAPIIQDSVSIEDKLIPGYQSDAEVALRIYRPVQAPQGLRPALFEIHGGGFMLGSIDMMEAWCIKVAREVNAVVVSVDYRLAPEHPFPAAIHDCYAGLSWLAEHAAKLGVDGDRIAISGQSAGAGLAAGTTLMAHDLGGPALCFQLLEIPELDDRLETHSMRSFDDTPMWNRPNAVWSWRHYLGPDHQGEPSPYAAPARAKSLKGLPSSFISTMEFDPLRDEGIHYAMALMKDGVAVELHNYPGTFHGSSLIANAKVSKRALRDVITALQIALKTDAE